MERIVTKRVSLNAEEPLYITALSDLHLDSNLAARDELSRILKSRASLPNHRVVIIGDLFDFILPSDRKRFLPNKLKNNVDDILNSILEDGVEFLKGIGVKYDLVSVGNHEHSVLKHHYFDVIKHVAKEIGADYGGYYGVLDYEIDYSGSRGRFRIVYHHGAWTGIVNSAVGAAKRYFMWWPDWDVALFGHSHDPFVKPEVRPRIVKTKNRSHIEMKKCFIVNCGSFVSSSSDKSEITTFADLRGYPEKQKTAPLICVTPHRYTDNGKRCLVIDVNITV